MTDRHEKRKPTLLEQDRLRKDIRPLGGEVHTLSSVEFRSMSLASQDALERLRLAILSAHVVRFFRHKASSVKGEEGTLSGKSTVHASKASLHPSCITGVYSRNLVEADLRLENS